MRINKENEYRRAKNETGIDLTAEEFCTVLIDALNKTKPESSVTIEELNQTEEPEKLSEKRYLMQGKPPFS